MEKGNYIKNKFNQREKQLTAKRMNLIMNSLSIFLLLSFAFTIKADLPGVFNVKKYGAKSDGSSDISQVCMHICCLGFL